MKQNKNISDYKKLNYLITDLNIFVISAACGTTFLLNNSLSEHVKEIKRLSDALDINVPNWVKEYYSVIGMDV